MPATEPARMDLLLDEPGTRRMFVNTMRGMLYSVSYDGKTVTPYLDLNDPKWGHPVQFTGSERGFQSFAFHPQFAQPGTPGYGKFYTYADTTNMTPTADFVPLGTGHTHDEILLEWTAKDPKAAAYDGGAPRELFRIAHPFANHNGGQIAFNPLARPGSPEFGLLYIGSADGGSGGDPYNHAQNLKSVFGKILRIDPLGKNSTNGKYGIPPSNPFVKNPDALGEIYSYGHRNPQRFSWDPKNGNMFEAEIGQNINEEINQITAGANYGWNVWEGSFKYFNREVSIEDQRGDPKMTYPDRRLRPHRPAVSVRQARGHRHLRVSREGDQAADRHADLRRQPERRDLLRERRQAAERRAEFPPDSVQRQGRGEDAAAADQGKERPAGQAAGDARRPAHGGGTQRTAA